MGRHHHTGRYARRSCVALVSAVLVAVFLAGSPAEATNTRSTWVFCSYSAVGSFVVSQGAHKTDAEYLAGKHCQPAYNPIYFAVGLRKTSSTTYEVFTDGWTNANSYLSILTSPRDGYPRCYHGNNRNGDPTSATRHCYVDWTA